MCSSNSSQVMTPGVASGGVKPGQVHLGYAPTSLHMSSQMPANLFCMATRCCMSVAMHDLPRITLAEATGTRIMETVRILPTCDGWAILQYYCVAWRG